MDGAATAAAAAGVLAEGRESRPPRPAEANEPAMITFLTLFLGLVHGVHPVEVAAEPPVARVELLLDGEPVGAAAASPFSFEVDFGAEPAPHRLTAIGREAEGREVDRASLVVNRIPRESGLEITLERDDGGRPRAARLRCQSAEGEVPERIALWLDGEPLAAGWDPAGAPERVPLPPLDGDIHFLAVELYFPGGGIARAERVFGGERGREIDAENTAVALEVDGRRQLRRPEQAKGLLRVGGVPAGVLAVEHGAADLVIVRERSAFYELAVMAPRQHDWHLRGVAFGGRNDDRFFLVSPAPRPLDPDYPAEALFTHSPALSGSRGGLIYWLAYEPYDPGRKVLPQDNTQATAVAGMVAANSARPRAVLLVLGPEAGAINPEETARVRGFLERLRVPLGVWYVQRESPSFTVEWHYGPEPPESAEDAVEPVPPPGPARDELLAAARQAWGDSVVDVGTFQALVKATRALRERVSRQRIVWIDGDHLPAEVSLAPGAPARPAGGAD